MKILLVMSLIMLAFVVGMIAPDVDGCYANQRGYQ